MSKFRKRILRKQFTAFAAGAIVLAAAITQLGVSQTTQPADVLPSKAEPSLRDLYSTSPDQWPAANWDPLVPEDQRHELAVIPPVTAPESNPFTREKAELGRQLFWDPRLSKSLNVACVSCHHPDTGWTDNKTVSQGHQLTPLDRNTPTIMGAALQPRLMWDARVASLETQAILPIANEKEMHGGFTQIVENLNAITEYRESFKKIFGADRVKLDHVAMAIATFERTIVPGRSRFDVFLKGRTSVLTDQQIEGLHLFRTKARCINCHSGPLLSDGQTHNQGLTYYGRSLEDLGQYNITNKPEDVGKFRTPTLRNITRTAPYMHNGLFELEGVLNLYNAGMPNEKIKDPNDPLAPKKSPLLKPLDLTSAEREALIAFMKALEEPKTRVRAPRLPGLYGATTAPADDADAEP